MNCAIVALPVCLPARAELASGEGMTGFARAFFLAGAGSVLAAEIFWKWTSPTQQRLTTSGWVGGDVSITFNTQNNSCTDFRGMNGRLLVPWSGTVNMPD